MKPESVLFKHNLKRTSCREGIIEVIMSSKSALSENEIKERLHGNYDRTTFYRSFKTLEENHIIHKIVVDNQIIKYALDNEITEKKEHMHFFCTDCNNVICMDEMPMKIPKVPVGFTVKETEVVIKGICGNCNLK